MVSVLYVEKDAEYELSGEPPRADAAAPGRVTGGIPWGDEDAWFKAMIPAGVLTMIVSVSVRLAFFSTLLVVEGDGWKAVGLLELLDIMQLHAELMACVDWLQFSR